MFVLRFCVWFLVLLQPYYGVSFVVLLQPYNDVSFVVLVQLYYRFVPIRCSIPLSPFLLCIFVVLFIHYVVGADIPLDFKLSVVNNDFWVSSNGVFAIGFFNIPEQPNQFSVGIRFNSKYIPYSQQTMV
ncbi:hypothetical protein VNO78_08580 [Psophocarpus tetragonolobus]|uniref:Uncharacterized protein n=1 Tax=Psophocarpus tetragonolobus TaxID=3891 RepID=A0AAN9XTI9_PSOTE